MRHRDLSNQPISCFSPVGDSAVVGNICLMLRHMSSRTSRSALQHGIYGCTYNEGSIYVATDPGMKGDGHCGSLVKINSTTLEAETLLNNFYQQPFFGFNDLDIDVNGNF